MDPIVIGIGIAGGLLRAGVGVFKSWYGDKNYKFDARATLASIVTSAVAGVTAAQLIETPDSWAMAGTFLWGFVLDDLRGSTTAIVKG